MQPVLHKCCSAEELEVHQTIECQRAPGALGLPDLLELGLQVRELIVLGSEAVTVRRCEHGQEALHRREGPVWMYPGGLIGPLGIEMGQEVSDGPPGVCPHAPGIDA